MSSACLVSLAGIGHILSGAISSLISSPVKVEPTIVDSLSHLIIDYRGPWVQPWIHRVYAGMASKYGDDDLQVLTGGGITLRLSGVYRRQDSAAKDKYAPASWCEGLPRSLPGSMFHILKFTLHDLRFHSTAELLRFVQGSPLLSELSCTKLKFDKDMPPQFTDRHRRARNRLRHVRVTDCGSSSDDLDLAFWIFHVQAPHGVFKRVLLDSFSQWDILHSAAHAICGASTFKEVSVIPQFMKEPPECELYARMLDSKAVFSYQIHIRVVKNTPNSEFSAHGIRSMTFDFLRRTKVEDVASMGWQSIEQAALDMRPSEKLRINVHELPVFEWFLDAIPAGRILSQLCHPRNVEILYVHGLPSTVRTTAEEILRAPSTYTVDGRAVQLKRPQIIRLAGCEDDAKKQAFLREVLASNQAKHLQPQIDGALTSPRGTAVVTSLRSLTEYTN
ncbi:uncharacterized protein PHACADRAFT_30111 [Phanerochaete carnosa HHB-10118-sp]|uniref:Uncharacterized protein n=1 Tax=Phanerochaete carnosa (strain HHB-10118-sp) TaxID=650164 RepID=K5W1K8_PHACS|nr:uncharacterized protein PHACADRAFT_30111 [Phanerochaete carnosa HHB-10118-sp]EKM52995.1 hypothetical protein PHACADRAFT_30111 [Phanerochaete carnosa HHB-10118-sp]